MPSLSNKVALGSAWMVAMRLTVRSIGLVSTLILLRLLEPRDFGVVAMVTAVAAAIDTFRQFGFEVALIQNQRAGQDEYNTVWTLDVIFGFASGALIAVIAKPAAVFYSEPALVPLFYVIAATNVLHGFQNVGIVDFRKKLQFSLEFRFLVSIKLTGFFVTLGLAFWLRSYWALFIGMATTAATGVILSYVMHPYRPRLSLVSARKLFHFSRWMFLTNICNVVRLRGADFVIGRIAGTRSLGLFSLAYEISSLPTSELVAPINRALLPGFSQISDDPGRSSRAFVRASAVMALVSMPLAFGIAATAELIGIVILGEKWLEAIPLLKVLALSGAITAVLSPIGSALISLNRPKVVASLSLCNALVLLPTVIFLTSRLGVYGAALGILVTSVVFLPTYFTVGSRYIQISGRDIGSIFVRPIIASAIMYYVVSHLPSLSGRDALDLLLSVVIGGVVYAMLILGLWFVSRRPGDSSEAYVLSAGVGIIGRSGLGRALLRVLAPSVERQS